MRQVRQNQCSGLPRRVVAVLLALVATGALAGDRPAASKAERPCRGVKLPPPLRPLPRKVEDADLIELGRKLFFDKRLSRDNSISCATCHDPAKGFADGRKLAKGIQGRLGDRHTPSLINVGRRRPLFWDGRTASLEEQAPQPIKNPREMDMPLDRLERRLGGLPEYRDSFRRVFGGAATRQRVARALAAFQRTIESRDTPFDRYLGGDRGALSAKARRGMELFFGQARCAACHQGAELTDNQFHNVGTVGANDEDHGRRRVTGRQQDHGGFLTPQLREVGRTAPYMHNGRLSSLKEVVEHYNFGGVTDQPNEYRDEKLEVLYLSEEDVEALVAFLKNGLTSPRRATKNDNPRPD